jgi:glycosyltransferase involved in cell wall biosynthesis
MPEIWEGPQVVTVHDMIHERFPEFYNDPLDDVARRLKQRCIEHADAVICDSEVTRQDVERLYGHQTGKLYVIPIAYNEVFRILKHDEYDFPGAPEIPFLLYVGKRANYKNFQSLIEVYSQWNARKDIRLVVVGAKWSMAEMQHLERLGIRDRVQLFNHVDDQTLCKLYNRELVFVFPSLYEGFGIPLLEAMACGCPVIASRIPSTLEVAGDCPIYFEPSQPTTLLEALDRARSEVKNSARIQSGLERVHLFSWDRTARQTLEVYLSLLVKHHSSMEKQPTVPDV